MKAPLISVIVPNYNHAPYLRQRFDSIFGQAFQDFEVIILDDCSTDNSREIIEEYRNKPQVSHIVYNETNSGSPFKQWAKGFELAKGEYIWIAESDDWADFTFLENLIPILDNDSSLQLVFCDSIIEYKDKSVCPSTSATSQRISGKYLLTHVFSYDNAVCNASSVLFRKSSSQNISLDYQKFFGSGDYLFWIFLAEKGDFFHLAKPLNHFRQHESNTTTINRRMGGLYKENLRIHHYLCQKEYISFYEKQAIVLSYLKRIDNDIANSTGTTVLLQECRHLWAKEILSEVISKYIVKWGLKLWTLLH